MKSIVFNTALFCLYLLSSGYGLSKLKSSNKLLSLEFALGFGLYAIGFLIWLYILKRMPLSLAFPIAAGGLIVTTQILGYTEFNEGLSALKFVGSSAIIIGIICLSIESSKIT